jgi:hypothetical protein
MSRLLRKRHPYTGGGILLLKALAVLPVVAPRAISAEATVVETTTADVVVAADDATQLRGSLSMRAAPMSQIFAVLGAMTPLHFRYASPPDAVLTAEWKDALLLSSLEGTLHAARWKMHREGVDVFVFPFSGQETAAGVLPQGWQYWNDASPPPRRWMAIDALKPLQTVRMKSPAARVGKPQAAPSKNASAQSESGNGSNRVVVRWNNEPNAATSTAWSNVTLDIDATQRPGVQVFMPRVVPPANSETSSAAMPGTSVWLRWRLPLHFVPRGARLLLETPVAATLYVNGAPLLSRRTGISTLDLSRVLVTGENYLALHLANVPPELARVSKNPLAIADAPLEMRPLFRYEWMFDGAFNTTETENGAAD